MTDLGSITVVVPTFRRPHGIAGVLAGLRRQDDPGVAWDVLVVDNDEPPGAEPAFAKAAPTLPVAARLVHEPRRGSAHARNRGMNEATSDVVVFIDDDVAPTADWLRTLVEPILDERCDGTGGRVVLDPSVKTPSWWSDWMAGYLAAFDLGPDERALTLDDWVLTASIAMRADLLRFSGGFDVELGPRSGVPLVDDDVSLCRRFMAAGGRMRYVPSSVVVHELPVHRLQRRYIVRRLYAQGRSDWLLDRDELVPRALGGTGQGIADLRKNLGYRLVEGMWHPPVVFRSFCDLAFFAGFTREALRSSAAGYGLQRR